MYKHRNIDGNSKEELLELLNECEKALEIEKRYHETLQNMMEGFQIIGFDWTYLYLNAAAIRQSHYTEEELIGYTMMEKYPGIENTDLFIAMSICMNTRRVQQLENSFHFPDGTMGWFELHIQPVEEGIFILSMDITERKRAEDEIIRLNKVLEQKVILRTAQLANKNKELVDSIQYAQQIQKAFLPHRSQLRLSFANSFILFRPKDVVSGDFYWLKKGEGKTLFAVADCTGHGVPGALISIIGAHMLNDISLETEDIRVILHELNRRVKHALRQSNSDDSNRDGMDIALCSFDPQTNTIEYAGANRPFWLIRKDAEEVEEISATRWAIGGLTDDNQQFEKHAIKLEKGDTFYLASDGYADQDGGEKGKKFMKRNFRQLLLDIQHLPMDLQKTYLETFSDEWRGNRPQLDDILVMGIRI